MRFTVKAKLASAFGVIIVLSMTAGAACGAQRAQGGKRRRFAMDDSGDERDAGFQR